MFCNLLRWAALSLVVFFKSDNNFACASSSKYTVTTPLFICYDWWMDNQPYTNKFEVKNTFVVCAMEIAWHLCIALVWILTRMCGCLCVAHCEHCSSMWLSLCACLFVCESVRSVSVSVRVCRVISYRHRSSDIVIPYTVHSVLWAVCCAKV